MDSLQRQCCREYFNVKHLSVAEYFWIIALGFSPIGFTRWLSFCQFLTCDLVLVKHLTSYFKSCQCNNFWSRDFGETHHASTPLFEPSGGCCYLSTIWNMEVRKGSSAKNISSEEDERNCVQYALLPLVWAVSLLLLIDCMRHWNLKIA